MGVVIHGINTPLITDVGMYGMQYPVHDRITQVHVGGGHVDLRPEHPGAIRKFACPHSSEEIQAFLFGTVPVRAFLTGFGQSTTEFADFVGSEVVHIGFPYPDQVLGPLVELLKVVRGIETMFSPFEAEPADAFLYCLDVFLFFLDRVGIVKPQVATAVVISGQAEIEAD
jgi:hypothetical protein